MSFDQLRRILRSRAERRGYGFAIERVPWPFAGSLERRGRELLIRIDSRRSPADQLSALAHEAGHLLFGHFELGDEVWMMRDGAGDSEWEWEAEYFAMFALRSPETPAEWFLGEQLELGVTETHRQEVECED